MKAVLRIAGAVLLTILIFLLTSCNDDDANESRATIILVHGAWRGAFVWSPVLDNLGMFLDPDLNSLQVISKLMLGADYETDFVVIHEGASEGIIYELIEIESLHISAYTKKGQPYGRLTHAVQQIENWQQWMLENRYLFTKMLPNFNKRIIRDSNLRFTIVIGRR